ncbi:MAG: lipopolysaccharide biosynthesis [Pseudomonadota bacterium]
MVIVTAISAIAVTVAISLPPAYESRMRLIVESPQIPEELATSTVRTPPMEQLQVMQQKLLTRPNLLDIARRLNVLPNTGELNADQIVEAMRARTTIIMPRGRDPLPLMTVSFEAPDARNAAAVLNEYLTLIQQEDAEFRRGRAGDTLDFFEQEVTNLGSELDLQSARILQFKQANSGDLPDSLEFRLTQQASILDRINDLERDIRTFQTQRGQIIQLFEGSGARAIAQERPLTAEELRLVELQREYDEALSIFSPEHPRIRLLQARIDQAQDAIINGDNSAAAEAAANGSAPTVLDVQLAELDTRLSALTEEKELLTAQIERLNESIERTPQVSITLDELERRFTTIQGQFNQAEARLARAQTGDRIETRSRGQRISVIEQPAVPNQPTKPNRVIIAGGGTAVGIALGLALVLILELLNDSPRRPEDLVKKFEIMPFTTIPYIQTRRQTFFRRSFRLALLLAIVTGIPAVIYALHIFYLPLDLLADRAMNKIGIRW